MTRYQSQPGEFARRGFDSATASARVWERWQQRTDGQPPVDLAVFEPVADRDLALDSLDRIAEVAPDLVARVVADEGWLHRLVMVLGGSTALAQTLVRHPEEVEALREAPRGRGRDGWREFFASRVGLEDGVATRPGGCAAAGGPGGADRDRGARPHRPDALAIADEVAAELAHVADAVLEMSLAHARAEVAGWEKARLAILALGKTGAQELNYISDVDVIYVAEPAEGATVEEAMTVATKLAAAQARLCSAHTAEGTIWQVDAALRPEGKAGPLVRSIESCRAYYAKWAKNWEFQAMLKARPPRGTTRSARTSSTWCGPWCGRRGIGRSSSPRCAPCASG